jgi:hypothetical protein
MRRVEINKIEWKEYDEEKKQLREMDKSGEG